MRRICKTLPGAMLLAFWLSAAALPAGAADFVLGLQAYDQGDYRKAFTEWLPLALDGNPDAQFNIGYLYANGLGVSADAGEAAVWYGRAARAGISDAQFNLGLLYSEGRGVERDLEAAARWFFEAARRGHPDAQFNLGLLLAVGAGVAPDIVEAYKWTGLAVRQFEDAPRKDFALDTMKRYEDIMNEEEIEEAKMRIEAFDPDLPAVILEAPVN